MCGGDGVENVEYGTDESDDLDEDEGVECRWYSKEHELVRARIIRTYGRTSIDQHTAPFH